MLKAFIYFFYCIIACFVSLGPYFQLSLPVLWVFFLLSLRKYASIHNFDNRHDNYTSQES